MENLNGHMTFNLSLEPLRDNKAAKILNFILPNAISLPEFSFIAVFLKFIHEYDISLSKYKVENYNLTSAIDFLLFSWVPDGATQKYKINLWIWCSQYTSIICCRLSEIKFSSTIILKYVILRLYQKLKFNELSLDL